MSHTPVDKKTKITLGIVVGVLVYVLGFGFLSFLNYIESRAYLQRSKVFTSDGSRLFVGEWETNYTYEQVFFEKHIYIDGVSAYAGMRGRTLTIYLGGDVITRQCNTTDYPIWSPTKEELYFIDSEKDDRHATRIWKWSKAGGFQPITKVERNLFYVNASVDGNYLTALNYRADKKQKNALFVCSIDGKTSKRYTYGYYNFRAVMLSSDDFLVAQIFSSPFGNAVAETFQTYRWSPKTGIKTPFTVGKQARDVLAVDGKVFVFFQEPTYNYYPWMVARGKDAVTVGQLSRDLTRVERETSLREGNKVHQ